jgi:hypothetical protein
LDEYYVDKIVAHEEKGQNPKNWKFKERWVWYESEDDSWLNWTAVKDLAALDTYSKEHPELHLGWSRWVGCEMIEIFAEESFCKVLGIPDTLLQNRSFGL